MTRIVRGEAAATMPDKDAGVAGGGRVASAGAVWCRLQVQEVRLCGDGEADAEGGRVGREG